MKRFEAESSLNAFLGNILLTQKGQIISTKNGIELMRIHEKAANVFIFGAHNTTNDRKRVKLDCSRSVGLVYSDGRAVQEKIINPGQYQILLVCQIGKYAESCKLTPAFAVNRA